MTAAKAKTFQKPKPLWGFGWAGWCLLTIAIALAGLMIGGVDVRHWILARITWNLGIHSTTWFVAYFLSGHGIFDFLFLSMGSPISSWVPVMRFSVLTMCIALIALQVHPRRTGPIRVAALILLGVVTPGLTMQATAWLMPLFPEAKNVAFDPAPALYAMTIFAFGFAAIATAILGWVSRSVWISLRVGLMLAVGAWVFIESMRSVPGATMSPLLLRISGDEVWVKWLSRAWNPAILAVMLTWAIRARLRVYPPHSCQSCGYDLRGTTHAQCPECGVTPKAPDVPSNPREAASTS